jgi:LuxR family maltose regulon positive regulatory protein
MIESHAMDMLMQWHLKTVDGWMRSIPAEWIAQSPQANLAFAWMHLMRPDYPQASPYLDRLRVMFSDPGFASQDPALLARWLALQAMLLNAQGQAMECLELSNQALELIPEGDDHVRNMIYLELAKAYEQLDDYDNAVETYQRIIRSGQTKGNSVAELLGISALALLALKHGQLHFAYEIITEGIDRIERAGALPPISTAVYGELGVIHYQWHQLEEAHHYFQRAIQVSTLSGYSDAELFYGVILSRLYQIEGDMERAAEEIRKAVNLMKVQAPAAVREEVIAQEIRISLAQDHLVAAESSLKRLGSSFKDRLTLTPHAPIQNISALRILLYRAQIRDETINLKQGIELADQLVDSMMEKGYNMVAIETLLLRAQLHTVLGDAQESTADFLTALQLGESEDYISIFVEEGPPIAESLVQLLQEDLLESVSEEYVRNILAAFTSIERPSEGPAAPASQAEPGEQLIESLTERELEVLRLMAGGLKYKEIGERLYISLNTVRYHVKSIYSKLNVNNRTKAIEKAHQLGIL